MKLKIAPLILAALTSLALLGCAPYVEPVAIPTQAPQLYADAQSTLDSGENRLENLSDQADDLSDQADVVGQEMDDAAATQQSITVQNQADSIAEATAQSEAATAAFLSDRLNATQTAQAQAEMALTSQSIATQQAFSLTATTGAALQAAAAQKQDEAEQRARWTTFVVNPVKAALLTLLVLLLIVVGVMFAWRLFQALEILPRLDSPGDHGQTFLRADGVIVQPAAAAAPIKQRVLRLLNTSQSREMPRVEILSPTEPSIINWIIEAEQKLRSGGEVRP